MTYTGMFLSLLILIYNGYRGINRYLSGFLFLSSFYIYLQLIIAYSKNVDLLAVFGVGFPTLYYLVGPLAFFYVRGMLKDSNRLGRRDAVHFIPIAFILAGVLPYMLFASMEEKREVARIIISDNWTELAGFRPNKFLSTLANEGLKAIQGILYTFLLWGLLYQNRRKLFVGQGEGEHRKLIRNWLLIFCATFSLLATMRVVYSWILIQAPAKSDFLAMTYPFHFIGAIGFFGMNIALIAFPGILYGLPVAPAFFRKKSSDTPDLAEVEKKEGQERVEPEKTGDRYTQYFSAEYLLELEAAIGQWVSEQRYLEADCTMVQLAVGIDVPYHHLSYYFNYVKKEKFVDWRNRLKIHYACQLMQEGRSKTLTMEAISTACGFSSKATFYRLFKQRMGQTPSEYLEELGK